MLCMPNVKILGILTINCNTINTKEADEAGNHKTNIFNGQESTMDKQYVNMRQKVDLTEMCYTNTDNIFKN